MRVDSVIACRSFVRRRRTSRSLSAIREQPLPTLIPIVVTDYSHCIVYLIMKRAQYLKNKLFTLPTL